MRIEFHPPPDCEIGTAERVPGRMTRLVSRRYRLVLPYRITRIKTGDGRTEMEIKCQCPQSLPSLLSRAVTGTITRMQESQGLLMSDDASNAISSRRLWTGCVGAMIVSNFETFPLIASSAVEHVQPLGARDDVGHRSRRGVPRGSTEVHWKHEEARSGATTGTP